VSEDLLVELFTQVGRVNSVHMPKDKLTGLHGGYGFVEFLDVADADYAIQIMGMVKLFSRPMRVNKSSLDKKSGQNSLDVGANLFIGNLDPADVDEKLLYDTFSAFGTIIKPPKIMRDDMTNTSKGFGFVSFDAFEASDLAIECMNNQYLCNRQISVQYSFKRASTGGEGSGGHAGAAREPGRADARGGEPAPAVPVREGRDSRRGQGGAAYAQHHVRDGDGTAGPGGTAGAAGHGAAASAADAGDDDGWHGHAPPAAADAAAGDGHAPAAASASDAAASHAGDASAASSAAAHVMRWKFSECNECA